ncbi:MAG TPA: PhoPQ-activated protein PqaA family protein, partial [Armatimonadota bacterium]|nr:PhoPQ-activated protein PqaA family protein [Armatimonadota bacterium]
DAFTWELNGTTEVGPGKVYDLSMVSQVWQGITWEHQIQIYEPRNLKYTDMMPLMITGGGADDESQTIGLTVANMLGTRIAVLYHIPKQPLFDGLKEDALISYTWMKYMETGDEDWILNFPMTKATVRAMDALDAFSEEQLEAKVSGYMVFGASKRGWTTYMTGIVAPERCVGIAPMVFDILNMPVQIGHQRDFWGDYSPMIHDYTDKGIQSLMDTERGYRLGWIVDPYSYRDKLTMPKLVILGSNDPYWPIDAVNQYYRGLPNPRLLLIAPNSGHGLDDLMRVLGSMGGFYRLLAEDKPMPVPQWQWTEDADSAVLEMTAEPVPDEVRVWVARQDKRDFRDAEWEASDLTLADGAAEVDIERKDGKYTAAYGEMVFLVDGLRLTVSTQPYVLHP